MSKSIGDILIIGAGAIGGSTGAFLFEKGADVCFINRKGEHYEVIKSNGLLIEGNEKPIKIPIYHSYTELNKKFKHIFVVTKNQNTEDVMKEIDSVLTPESLVYSMQNGFGNTDIMAEYIPREQIVAGVVSWAATKSKPGVISLMSKSGEFVLGFEGKKSIDEKRLLEIKEKLDPWRRTILTENIIGFRWSKLIVNSVIAPLGALLDLNLGEMFIDKRAQDAMRAIKEEGVQIAERNKVKLEKVDNLDIKAFFYRPKRKDGVFTRLKYRIVSKVIAKVSIKRHGRIRSSLYWDLQHGRKTEIEFLNGYIVQKGKEVGLESPVNSFMVKVIHELENGKRGSGLHNFDELENIVEISREKVKEQDSTNR